MTRRVQVFKAGEIDPETRKAAQVLDYVGEFHCFTVDYEELQHGPAQFAVAIVEKPSGDVETVLLRNLQFVKELDHPMKDSL